MQHMQRTLFGTHADASTRRRKKQRERKKKENHIAEPTHTYPDFPYRTTTTLVLPTTAFAYLQVSHAK
jgi:hypothetical protein